MKRRKILIPILLITVCMVFAFLLPLRTKASDGMYLNYGTKSVAVGDSFTLKLNGATKKVKWSSNKNSVAKVSSKGKVKGKKAGVCYITAKCDGETYTCKVTVCAKGDFVVDDGDGVISGQTYVMYKDKILYWLNVEYDDGFDGKYNYYDICVRTGLCDNSLKGSFVDLALGAVDDKFDEYSYGYEEYTIIKKDKGKTLNVTGTLATDAGEKVDLSGKYKLATDKDAEYYRDFYLKHTNIDGSATPENTIDDHYVGYYEGDYTGISISTDGTVKEKDLLTGGTQSYKAVLAPAVTDVDLLITLGYQYLLTYDSEKYGTVHLELCRQNDYYFVNFNSPTRTDYLTRVD